MNPRTVFYASVGPLLKILDVDVEAAELRQRGAVTVATNIQYAWPHPSRRYLYVVSSSGGPGNPGDKNLANAFVIDPTNGDLKPHGKPAALPSRPIHFADGVLRNLASIAPGSGLGFGPRHLDFHPAKPWAFVSIERQNKLYVYAFDDATALGREPLFITETLANPKPTTEQGSGPIHVHANGKFVYLTNRTFPARPGGFREISLGGEDNMVVYTIDENSGEPKPIQHIDGLGVQLRTFGIDASGRMLVVASIMPMPRSDRTSMPAGITVFRIGSDGRLSLARKYDVEVGTGLQFWSGMLPL